MHRDAPGCTPETLVSPRHTRPDFSSNPKPCKEIIQTPTPLQVVWFPPHTTFLIYHHPKLNRNHFYRSCAGVHPKRRLYPMIPPQQNFLPVVCWGAPQQGLWPPRYPLTPNTHPGYTGVHPISIGLHPGRMGCTPGDIWTPAGAVMKGVATCNLWFK